MKILNKENNIEKIYVQLEDMMRLFSSDVAIPASIFDKVFSEPIVVDDRNRYDFIEFSDKNEVDFLNSIEWIIDCKKYLKANINKLHSEYMHVVKEINSISTVYNRMSNNEKRENEYLVSEYDNLNHKLDAIGSIIQFRNGNIDMSFPQVPDCDGLIFDDSNSTGYIIQEGLIPGTLLMYKSNGDVISRKDNAYPGLINNAVNMVRIKNDDYDEDNYNYHNVYSLSNDFRYLIISYREPKKNTFSKNENKNKCESLFKRLFKRFK